MDGRYLDAGDDCDDDIDHTIRIIRGVTIVIVTPWYLITSYVSNARWAFAVRGCLTKTKTKTKTTTMSDEET